MSSGYRRYTDAENALMARMWDEGHSHQEIADHFRTTLAAIKGAFYNRTRREDADSRNWPKHWPPHTDYSPDNLNVRT